MRYKTKIVPENGGYVGYLMLNENIVYATNTHPDTIMASRELTSFLAEEANNLALTDPILPPVKQPKIQSVTVSDNSVPVPIDNIGPALNVDVPPPSRPTPSPRKCCGRG